MYGSLIFGTIFLFSSICFGAADAASPILTLDPNPALSTGDGDGTTRITWSTGDDSVGQVYVSIDEGPENLFAQNSTGSQDITWIKANTKYEFKLYKGTEDRKLLKTVVVTREGFNAQSSLAPTPIGFLSFAATVLLLAGICVLLLWGTYYAYHNTRSGLPTVSLIGKAFSERQWPLWLVVITVVFLFTNHLLPRGQAIGLWDVNTSYYQYQVLVADHARAGRFISWDPWSNAGLPLSGDPEVGVYSPLNFIIGFVTGGTSTGFIVYWLLMWWLGGLGILLLARHLKAPSWGGCVVALGFLFCGVYTGNAQHTSIITAFSFLPFIIWRLDAALCSHKWQPAAEAGALWGLSALAGYPAMTIITGCFCALWAAGRWACAESFVAEGAVDSSESAAQIQPRPTSKFVALTLALVLLVGFLVLSPAYFAFFYEGDGVHERVGELSREVAVGEGALHPGALSTFASPYLNILKLYSKYNRGSLWSYTDVSMSSIYTGAPILVLAVYALLRRPRDRWRWWLVGLAAFSLACALGQTLPLRGWLYDWFYPMRFFRHTGIFRSYYLFTVAVLAVVATRDLAAAIRHQPDRTAWKPFSAASAYVASCAVVAFIAVANSVPNTGINVLTIFLSKVHAAGVWVGICGVALTGWMLPSRFRQWSVPALLVALAAVDAFLTHKVSTELIFDTRPKSVARWNDLDAQHSAALDLTGSGLQRERRSCLDTNQPCTTLSTDQMITKVAVFNSYTSHKNPFHLRMLNQPVLRNSATGADRIWFAKDVVQVDASKGSFEAFLKRAQALGAPPLVVHDRGELLSSTNSNNESPAQQVAQIETLPAAEKIAVNLERYSPDELAFSVECPSDGWLLVTDRWARSWQAKVNGKQTAVYGGNFIFRAIQVSAGQNQVRFTYDVLGFPWLLIISWGTLAVVAISSAYFHWRGYKSVENIR